MKNTKSSIILLAAALIFAMGCMVISHAAGGAGTAEDPVVTKSYVDAQIAALAESVSRPGTFEVLQLQEGQSLITGKSAEIILRSGTAVAIGSEAGGVSDVTAGTDLKSGDTVTKNHLLIVPQDDGRGIQCQSMSFVMVKGSYTIN
ncbi:MAG: hypothetical protein GX975_02280 [Clostridiales bacterium]|nr:hypothetical protein [Clostridiales bacterium]